MIGSIPQLLWRALCAAGCFLLCISFVSKAKPFQAQTPTPPQTSANQSREQGSTQRIPRQQAQVTAALDGIVRDAALPNSAPVPGAALTLRNLQSGQTFTAASSAEGVFRLFPLPPGTYELRVESENYAAFALAEVALEPNEIATLEISLVKVAAAAARARLPRLPDLGPALPAEAPPSFGTDRELRHR